MANLIHAIGTIALTGPSMLHDDDLSNDAIERLLGRHNVLINA